MVVNTCQRDCGQDFPSEARVWRFRLLTFVDRISPTTVLPEISPLGNPSIDDIERAGKQRLARSADDKAANTADARLLFFLNYVEFHGRSHNYLTVDVERILFTYTTWLLSGNSILATDTNLFYIKVGTIKGYLGEVTKHYAFHAEPPPYDSRAGQVTCTKELLDDAKI